MLGIPSNGIALMNGSLLAEKIPDKRLDFHNFLVICVTFLFVVFV
jgi:hypothetical protein